jgi:hypothetical protein
MMVYISNVDAPNSMLFLRRFGESFNIVYGMNMSLQNSYTETLIPVTMVTESGDFRR